jgi:cytochrome c peroxidase
MPSPPFRPSIKRVAFALAGYFALAAPPLLCAEDGVIDLAALPNYARQVLPSYIIQDNTPRGPGGALNPITNTGATLGRLLFYDKRLSRNNTVSCSSCHQQAHGFGNPDIVGTGVAGTTNRHPMRLINERFRSGIGFFWDRRVQTLESLVTQPIRSQLEMGFSGTNGDPDFAALVAKLSALPEYQLLFNVAFASPGIDEERIQKALSQFVRSIQSFDSKFDAGIAAADGLGFLFPNFTDSENRGKQLFFDLSPPPSGGGHCSLCHTSATFANSTTGNNGVIAAIGGGTDLTVSNSPTLRDLVNPSGQLNTPLMHNGSFTSIAQVINHYTAIPGNPRLASDLGGTSGQTLNLSQQDRLDLEAFLGTLSGKAVYTDPKWSNPFRPDGTITVIDTTPPAAQTVNLSTRMQVLTADKVGIGGFIITGTAPKRILVRALGPSLVKFGLSTVLADPRITLQGSGFGPLLNEGWRSDQETEIKATGLAPGDDREPAIVATLAPGAYTAVLSGTNDGTGTGILEIYDLDFTAASKLGNISTRAFVGTADNIVIAGFTVGNASSVDHILVRGLGPTLNAFGIGPALFDPTLEVRNANGERLGENDNWMEGSEASEVTDAGLELPQFQESAVVLTLGPGAYTALLSPSLRPSNNPPGVALVEVYSRGRVP